MSKFMNGMANIGYTENGARGVKSTNNPIVDLNFSVPSLRDDDERRTELFTKALTFDKIYALKWLLYYRDVRGGLQERFGPIKMLEHIFNNYDESFIDFNSFIDKFIDCGRFDDVMKAVDITAINSSILKVIFNKIKSQLESDSKSDNPSLLVKYFTSNHSQRKKNAKSVFVKRKHDFVKNFIKYSYADVSIDKLSTFDWNNPDNVANTYFAAFKRITKKIRAKLNLVETAMSNNQWSEIDYSKLPSKANVQYNKAFFKHDEERRASYIESIEKGEAKINVTTNSLPQLWSNLFDNTNNSIIEAAMAKMISEIELIDKKMMVCIDDSGSMTSRINGQSISALNVAHSLGVAISSRMTVEGLHKRMLAFSATPRVLDFSKYKSFKEIRKYLEHYSEIANTNIERVFLDLLSLNLPTAEMPEIVLCISDGEFDAGSMPNKNLFNTIEDKYKAAGYVLPKIVMWNVNSRTNIIPFENLENGAILVSGYSLSILKMVLSMKLDSWSALKDILDNERYNF